LEVVAQDGIAFIQDVHEGLLQSIYKHILIILFQQQRVSVLRSNYYTSDVPGILISLIRQLTCPHFVQRNATLETVKKRVSHAVQMKQERA
jgi:hypothetical protein